MEYRRKFVDDQHHARHFESASDLDRDSCSLVILLVGAQDNDQHVRDGHRKQGLFVQAGVRVYEERVQAQRSDQVAEAAVQQGRRAVGASERASPGGQDGHRVQPDREIHGRVGVAVEVRSVEVK